MRVLLKSRQNLSQKIYLLYIRGYLTQKEYLKLLKPLDKEIERIEMKVFSTHPQDISVFEKSFLRQLH